MFKFKSPSLCMPPKKIILCRKVARLREANCRHHGVVDRTVLMSDWLRAEILGTTSSAAVSCWSGVPWNQTIFTAEQYKNPSMRGRSVGGVEVRGTPYAHGCLLIQRRNPDNVPYVLVTVDVRMPAVFTIVGWCYAGEGKKNKWWKVGERNAPCYYVPQSHLRPADGKLLDLIRGV